MQAVTKYLNHAIVNKTLNDLKRNDKEVKNLCPNCGYELDSRGICQRCGYCGG